MCVGKGSNIYAKKYSVWKELFDSRGFLELEEECSLFGSKKVCNFGVPF